MERFVGKIAVVTGSSAGIGEAIAKELVKRGVIVVGLARRIEKLKKLSDELRSQTLLGKFHAFQCDLAVEKDIENTFRLIVTTVGPISILINNAGVNIYLGLENIKGEDIDRMYSTNVKGLILASKEAINSMNANNTGGHIVNICSALGIKVSPFEESFAYSGSKHSVRCFSESMRLMNVNRKSNIKISNLSPGLVMTEMPQQNAAYSKSVFENDKMILRAEDVVNACITVLDTPPNVLTLTDRSQNLPGKFHIFQCNVSVEEDVKNAFHKIKTTIGPISILVNNAGVASYSRFKDLLKQEIDAIFDTNVKGLVMVTKEAINSMEENRTDGHILGICSTAGSRLPPSEESIVYAGSKHAVRGISEGLRLMNVKKKSNIKISVNEAFII